MRGQRKRTLGKLLAGSAVAALLMVSAAQAAVIEGKVTDQTRTVALEGAIVRIVETGQSTVSGRDGSFRFPNVPEGAYTLEISYIGAAPVTVSVTASDAAPAPVVVLVGEDVPVLENVLVIGQRGAQAGALNQQRAADNIKSVVSADAVGQFPDQNVSEAARRIVGLSVENDQGEGRYVVIRGIDPNLNATTINGVSLPSPEGDGRQVQLDVIDSDLLDGIEVTKSLTPDMDGDAIGGAINIKTLSAFDRDGAYVSAKGSGSYNDLTGEWSPKLSARGSTIFAGDRFGVAGSLSWFDREFATENKEVDGIWFESGGDWSPEEVELRDYVVNRERLSAALNFDFKPNESNSFFLRTVFSDYEDQEFRSRMEAKFDEDAFIGIDLDGNALFDAGLEDIAYEKSIKDRLETATVYSVQVGGETLWNAWTFDYVAAFSHSEETNPDAIDSAQFALEFDGGEIFGANVSDPLNPILYYGDPADRDTILNDASAYEFDSLDFVNSETNDDEIAFGLNARYDTSFGAHPGFVKVGVKARLREKDRDENTIIYDGFSGVGGDQFMDQISATVDYPLDALGLVPFQTAFREFFNANRADFDIDADDTFIASTVADYTAEENIYAGFLMGRIDINALRLVGGARVEFTEFDAEAFAVEVGGPTATATALSDDYTDILPSVNARWEITPDLIARAAYFASVSRPNFAAIVPAVEFEEDDPAEYEGAAGNPDIERQKANNFDLSVEYYPGGNSVFQAGVFYKDIEDFIAFQVQEDVTFAGLFFTELETFVNLSEAKLLGVEFNAQQTADFLPAPFDGIIYGLNATFVDGQATLPSGIEVPLPKQSERIANAVLGYEKGRFSMRAALSYRSEYLDELIGAGGTDDRYVDEHTQLDLKAKVDITDNIQIFAELNNVTDEPFTAYFDQAGGKFLSQYEEYGYTAQFGLSITR